MCLAFRGSSIRCCMYALSKMHRTNFLFYCIVLTRVLAIFFNQLLFNSYHYFTGIMYFLLLIVVMFILFVLSLFKKQTKTIPDLESEVQSLLISHKLNQLHSVLITVIISFTVQ